MYLIFGGECYYGSGGANDYLDCRDTLEEAIICAKLLEDCKVYKRKPLPEDLDWDGGDYIYIQWLHVFDTTSKTIVFKCGDKPYGDNS